MDFQQDNSNKKRKRANRYRRTDGPTISINREAMIFFLKINYLEVNAPVIKNQSFSFFGKLIISSFTNQINIKHRFGYKQMGNYLFSNIRSSSQDISHKQQLNSGREGTLGCLMHYSPKFYNDVIFFLGSTTLGIFINFDWFVH